MAKKEPLTLKGSTAADIYEVQDYYQRFNQKYNITRQRLWNPEIKEAFRSLRANIKRNLEKKSLGYDIVDWALYIGSRANMANTGFNINCPNRPGNRWTSISSYPGQVVTPIAVEEKWQGLPSEASRMIRKKAKLYGADNVGFCRLDRRWVYSHYLDEETLNDYPIKFSDEPGYEQYDAPAQTKDNTLVIPKEMEHVIVMIHEMEEEGIASAPTLSVTGTSNLAYSRISFTTNTLAEFIRGLGYNAIPSANCTALNIPLAIDAGLGQLGRNGKLITPEFGPRCRISKVITDLPLEPGKPINFGVTEFCNSCKKCARECPAQAIPYGDRSYEPVNEDCGQRGILLWQLNHKKCEQFFHKVGTNCGICLRVCPFNKSKGKIHDVVRWFVKNIKWVNPLIVRIDDALGYGKFKPLQHF